MSAQTYKKPPEPHDDPVNDSVAEVTMLQPGRQADNRDVPGPHLRVYDSIIDLAPNPDNPTPMVRLSARSNPHSDYEVLLKLEGMNPFGSIKDRTALFMLRGLHLKADQALVEPSAGNTGIALAAMANARNTPIEIAVPDGTPEEKKALLRFLGVELIEVEDELCPLFPTEGARGVVKSMVESEAYGGKYVSPNQYESELNVEAHYRTTGPEIWKQTNGEIDYFFAGIGTGGTISGVGRFLKEQKPDIRIIGVEPASRHHQLSGLKRITGLPDEHYPKILDPDLLDDLISVSDEEAYTAGIELARTEGIMVGPTTGALLAAALRADTPKTGKAVLISADNAAKYASAYAKYL
ncbi:MAG: PLP-dependent cysteine synthase family protein [Gammaproteobacteria bacterium]|jgi:cysteine synthase A/cysteine synthase B|nr:PLP-dependent cysteine synthase family protein [Gammaproteobacteria bacterium]MDH3750049.1 PLP-dependent cysteine synthase family protein [Gammaproteobacteria bacterium]MDH3806446.1 PLP-dependent cysteine synthase family protein [Gammaproteobacteria bacterium]